MKHIIRYLTAIISLAFTSNLLGWNVSLNDAEPDGCVYSEDQFTVAIEAGDADCQIYITDNESGQTVAGAFLMYSPQDGYHGIALSGAPGVSTTGGTLPGGGIEVVFTHLPEGRNYTMSIFCPELDREYATPIGFMDYGTCTFDAYSSTKFCRASSWIGGPLYNRLDLRRSFPLPKDQGNWQKSCVAWAVSEARTYQLAKKRGLTNVSDPSVQLSPAYIYNQISPEGNAILVEDALILVRDQGCATLSSMPYYSDAEPKKGQLHPPTDAQRQNANLNKMDGFRWYHVGSNRIDEIRSALEAGNPVIITFNIRVPDEVSPVGWQWVRHGGTLLNPVPYYTYEPYLRYADVGHAVCVVGYDDARRKLIYIDSLTIDYKLRGIDFTGWPVQGIPNDDTHACYKERSYDDEMDSATVMVQD